ncbi:MAG: cyclic nucleotide-binding domain-containing protein [Gammaproteobacteria bacterium]|nr:cyclic nucleotide-binding domain-containing protein [Gammaproteobacteria bacterium]
MTLNNTISNHIKSHERAVIHNASWLKRFLKSGTYLRLPAANLQQFVAQLQEIPVRGGQNIVTQCAKANHYYIIKEGRGNVTRRSNNQNVNLAVVSAGEGFGEDAIISHQQRNATVTMLETGSIMRLSAESFMSLIVSPIIKPISYEKALIDAAANKVLIDVRSNERHSSNGLKNSINIPLMLIRSKIQNLHPNQKYILYCDNGQTSSTAAFILTQEGFSAEYIEGGVALQNTLKSPRHKQSNTQTPSHFALVTNEDTFEEVDIDIEAEIANIQAQLESLSDIETAIENTNKVDHPIEESQLWTSTPLPEPDLTEEKKTHEKLAHGWVDDTTLWENMLGYRSDPKIDQLLEAHEEITLTEKKKSFSPQQPHIARTAVHTSPTLSTNTAPKKTKKQNKRLKYAVTGIAVIFIGLYSFAFYADEKQFFKDKLSAFTNSIIQDTHDLINQAMTFSTQSTKTTAIIKEKQQNKARDIDLKRKQIALIQSKKEAEIEFKRKLKLKNAPLPTPVDIEITNTNSNAATTTEIPAQTMSPEASSISAALIRRQQPEASVIPLTQWTPEANDPSPGTP